MNPASVSRHLEAALNELRLARDCVDPLNDDCYEEISDAMDCIKAAAVWMTVTDKNRPRPIHKFNGGRGATICNKCRVVIREEFTDELYCETCKPEE